MVDLDSILPHLMNSRGLIELFGLKPRISSLNFSAMQLASETSALQLVLTTPDVPEKIKAKGANTVGIILDFSNVTELSYKGPIKENEEVSWRIESVDSTYVSTIGSVSGVIVVHYKHLILTNIGRRTELTFKW